VIVTEEWRVMPNGMHEVSNLGRVRRASPAPGAVVGAVLKTTVASHGYPTFKSRRPDGRRATVCVHRVVAELFLGPAGDMHVNHKNGDKTDNRLSNLEYVTPAQNSAHAARSGLTARGDRHGSATHPESVPRGERHSGARLTSANVIAVREAIRSGRTRKSVGDEFGVSEATVRHVLNGDTWRHHGFTGEAFPSQRARRGAANGNAKLTVEQVRAIREAYGAKRATQTALAVQFGVSQATINNVVLGKVYAEVDLFAASGGA